MRSTNLAIVGAKFVFLDFLEFKAFQAGKKLYHISYLPKGYTWTKIEKNRFFDFCRRQFGDR